MAGRISLLTVVFFFHFSVSAATYYASPGDDLQAKIAALSVGDTLYFNEGVCNWNDALRFGLEPDPGGRGGGCGFAQPSGCDGGEAFFWTMLLIIPAFHASDYCAAQ